MFFAMNFMYLEFIIKGLYVIDLEQAASRLAKSLQAKLFSRLAWLAWFFGLEKAWLARPKLGLACKQKKLAYVRLGLACMKAWLDKTSLNQAFLQLKPSLSDIIS